MTRSESTDQLLNFYSIAAAAAGVSVLALAQPTLGEVVITRKTIPIPANTVDDIDLNHDGIADFQLSFRSSFVGGVGCDGGGDLSITWRHGGAVVGNLPYRSNPYASALIRGAKIGPSAHLLGGSGALIENSAVNYCSGSSHHSENGHWGGNPPNRYLGVKFLIRGETHYGWIRLTADFPARLGSLPSASITAYAYETVGNKMITAGNIPTAEGQADVSIGKPSLGVLALGADGLSLWRQEEVLPSHSFRY